MTDSEFGKLLKQRRGAAMLTLKELGSLAKISDSTIKLTESGRKPATLTTVSALLTVPELRLRLEELPERFRPALARHEQSGIGGLPFLRFCLTNIGLSTQEAVLRSVLDWCSEQQSPHSQLEAWIRSQLRVLEQKRKTHLQLEEEKQEEDHGQTDRQSCEASKAEREECCAKAEGVAQT